MDIQNHKRKYIHHELNDKSVKGKFLHSLREIVFGLQDGIVSTLGAITGIAAGVQDSRFIILSGLVVIAVESISMAAGTFLSSKSERQFQERLLREEAEEIENFPEAERAELVVFYKDRGFPDHEIEIIVNRITKDKKLWLEEMAHKELGVFIETSRTPRIDAVYMGLSYITGGLISICMYFFFPIQQAFYLALIFSIAMLFIIGVIKGKLVQASILRSGVEMMLVSLTAAALGYIVGRVAASFFGIDT